MQFFFHNTQHDCKHRVCVWCTRELWANNGLHICLEIRGHFALDVDQHTGGLAGYLIDQNGPCLPQDYLCESLAELQAVVHDDPHKVRGGGDLGIREARAKT